MFKLKDRLIRELGFFLTFFCSKKKRSWQDYFLFYSLSHRLTLKATGRDKDEHRPLLLNEQMFSHSETAPCLCFWLILWVFKRSPSRICLKCDRTSSQAFLQVFFKDLDCIRRYKTSLCSWNVFCLCVFEPKPVVSLYFWLIIGSDWTCWYWRGSGTPWPAGYAWRERRCWYSRTQRRQSKPWWETSVSKLNA